MTESAPQLRWMYATDVSSYLCDMDGKVVLRYRAMIQRVRSGAWQITINGKSNYDMEPNRMLAIAAVEKELGLSYDL